MTREKFLRAYRDELKARYPWAADEAKLVRFMTSVAESITGGPKSWNHQGEAVTAAWRSLGGKGTPTLKQLKELPAA